MHKGVNEPSYRKRPAYHSILLGGVALLSSAGLVIGNLSTKGEIQLRVAEDTKQSLSQVIPNEIHSNDLLANTLSLKTNDNTLFDNNQVNVYRAVENNEVVAVAYQVVGQGYSGAIHVILGISKDGELLGVRVVSHTETPGLGDKIEEKKSNWIYAFNNLSLTNPGDAQWHVKKDGGQFDQFSGATITPRAVVKAIKAGLVFFELHKTEMLHISNNATQQSTS